MDPTTPSRRETDSARASRSPYRDTAAGGDAPRAFSRRFDADLAPMVIGLWTVSVVRVGLACLRHETFGAEATIAVLLVLVLSRHLLAPFGR